MDSYSFSKIALYNKCPFKYHKRYVERVELFDDSPVFEKGHFMHALLESYPHLPDFTFKFPEVEAKKLEMIEFICDKARNDRKIRFLLSPGVKYSTEQQFFLKLDGSIATGYADSAFNGKIDYVGRHGDSIILVDWKTGQTKKKASLEQLKFYSMWVFNFFPWINKVKLYLYFIEQDMFVTEEIDYKMYRAIRANYVEKVNVIEADKEFKKRRTEECVYCQFSKECNKIVLRKGE